MRLLFVKHSLAYPRASGHDVNTYYMMKACAALGHKTSLATVTEPEATALDGLVLERRYRLETTQPPGEALPRSSWLQRRFRSFWGVSDAQIAGLRRAVADLRPDVVVVAGLDALPYFPVLSGVVRVWYANDEWVLHHLSLIKLRDGNVRNNLWAAAVKGVYERSHRRVIDRVWVVSESDRRAMRWVAGMSHVDLLPSGVDGEFFKPGDEVAEAHTAVFWGRLDFGPNVQALQWFCHRVWPTVRRRVPDARFTIIGFQASEAVRALASGAGISLDRDVPDLRRATRHHAVAVLPMVSGAGIKNKLLEAAALGLPIVCTPRATRGLRGSPPLVTASTPDQFATALVSLWNDPERRRRLGADGRAWVLQHHTWTATAGQAIAAIENGRQTGLPLVGRLA